jgi:hypothetical protein
LAINRNLYVLSSPGLFWVAFLREIILLVTEFSNKVLQSAQRLIFTIEEIIENMGLPLRITFNDKDYVYQIINSNLINQNTTELELLLNGEKLQLIREKTIWIQKGGDQTLDPNLIQALGRSVSLRLRM